MLFAQIGSVAIAAPSTSLDARINVDFRQTALRPFLELVAQQSGRRLVMAPAADRMITVLARDTPTIDVLNDIGRRYGLRMNFENASITVDSLR